MITRIFKMDDDFYQNNDECEICLANKDYSGITHDIYWINTHCIELRRNRKARENKNVVPKNTVF